jgi:hypothetical protein
MKGIMKIGFALAACALVASLPASATCGIGDNRLFVGYSYFSGTTGSTADLLGSFWQVGNFGGANNGGWEANENSDGGSNLPWISIGANGAYINGAWASDTGIVGCPSAGVVKMAYVVTSPAAGNGSVFFAGCASSDPGSGNFSFGLSNQGATVPAQVVPKPNITGSTLNGTASVTVQIAAPAVPGGVLDEGACSLAPTGYKIYALRLPRNSPAPTNRGRVAGAWEVQNGGAAFPIGGPASVTVNTLGGAPTDIYLAYSLVFTDGVEVEHVGANSTVVHGGSTSSNQPSDFKIIKKPIKRPGNVN